MARHTAPRPRPAPPSVGLSGDDRGSQHPRVLHLLNRGARSGAESVAISIIQGCGGTGLYASPDGPIADVLRGECIPFVPLHGQTPRQVRLAVDRTVPDILHAHDYWATLAAAFSFSRRPVVAHIHQDPPWSHRPTLRSVLFLLASVRVDTIVYVSHSVRDEYVFSRLIARKSVVLPNPVDVAAIRAAARTAQSHDAYDIVFLGRLSPEKDPLRFVRLIDRVRAVVPGLSAAMIGTGPLEPAVAAAIASRGLADAVEMTGYLANPLGILSRAQLLCVPSHHEGFGLVAAEAIALGVPVVASRVGGLRETVTPACGALCDDDDDFVAEIAHLLSDPTYRAAKAGACAARAEHLSSTDTYFATLRLIYAAASRSDGVC